MRILVAGRGFDAPGRHVLGVFELDQARALRDAGHDVRFAALDTRSIRSLRPIGCRSYTLEGIPVIYGALPVGARPVGLSAWAQRRASEGIWRRLDQDGWRPELVHAHFGAAMLVAARRRGIHTVFTEHFSNANHDEVSREELARERAAYAAADRVLCVSRALADRIGERNAIAPLVVPNIVDPVFSTPPVRPRDDHKSFHIVSAGRLIPSKGYAELLRAFAAALRGTDAHLTIIGDGEERAALEALTESLGLAGHVTFTGQLDRAEMVTLYETADIFALASHGETFGVAYAEALAMGLPTVATDCGGPRDFLDDSNGILVPNGDETALAGALRQMMLRCADYDREAIARRARERFSPQKIAAELTAIYKDVIGC